VIPTSATEGIEYEGPIATVTVISGAVSYYTYTIDFGDGTSYVGSGNNALGASSFTIYNLFYYGEEGTYVLTLTVQDPATGSVASGTATVTVADAPLTAEQFIGATGGTPMTTTEGVPTGGLLATFTNVPDPPPNQVITATINWGDGTPSEWQTFTSGGTISVSATHTYLEPGAYGVSVWLYNPGGFSSFPGGAGTTVLVTDPPLTGSAAGPVSTTAGRSLTDVPLASFADPHPDDPSQYLVSIAWGDGTIDTDATLTLTADGFDITGSHTYDYAGNFTARVTIRDDGYSGTQAVSVSLPVTVAASSPPDSDLSGQAFRLAANEGDPLNHVIVANFTDADPTEVLACFSASISWGDGTTSAGTLAGDGHGGYNVFASHTYASAGSYVVAVSVSDDDGHFLTVSSTALIGDRDLIAEPEDLTAAGDLVNALVAVFQDPNPNDLASELQATIDWGNGYSSQGTVFGSGGRFWVAGSTNYSQPGHFLARVIIRDSNEAPWFPVAVVTDQVTVGDVPEGVPYNLPIGFTDKDTFGTPSDYAVTVGWGDGQTSSPTVTGNQFYWYYRGFSADAQHAWDHEGTYPVEATIADSGGSQATTGRTVQVSDAPLSPGTNGSTDLLYATEGQALSADPLSTFSDLNPNAVADDFTAVIDWGDGTRSPGTVRGGDAGAFDVAGSHTYAHNGWYIASVLVTDADGASTVLSRTVYVQDAPLTAHGEKLTALSLIPTGDVVVATFTDANPYGTVDDFTAWISWGDGWSSFGTILANGDGTFSVIGSHNYSGPGSGSVTYTITTTINDRGGATATATGTATVLPPEPVTGLYRMTDPAHGFLVPVGEALVDPNTSGLRLSQPLDFDQSPGTAAGGDPALVYNSDTVHVRPIVELTLPTDVLNVVPSDFQARVAWNGGQPGPWVDFSTAGHQVGDTYLLAVQLPEPGLTITGHDTWALQVKGDGLDGGPLYLQLTGTADVVVRDQADPLGAIGAGWGIAGVDRLVFTCDGADGVERVEGNGDTRYFARSPAGGTSVRPTTSAPLSSSPMTPSSTPPRTRPAGSTTPGVGSPPLWTPTALPGPIPTTPTAT
jgi:hypothetical protein